jgi:hypothetical protein
MRVFYVHWDKEEALETVRVLRGEGHVVTYHWDSDTGDLTWKEFRSRPPDVLVVSLARLPSHGRRVAAVTKETKQLAEIPVVFLDGPREKLPPIKREFPRSHFIAAGDLVRTLQEIEETAGKSP